MDCVYRICRHVCASAVFLPLSDALPLLVRPDLLIPLSDSWRDLKV